MLQCNIQNICVEKLEEILGYTFTNRQLAIRALTLSHPKTPARENLRSLSYVGDRVFNLCVVAEITSGTFGERKPNVLEQKLQVRSSNQIQKRVAISVGLNKIAILDGQIADFPTVAKLNADILEAVYAAVFIDTGYNFHTIFNIHRALHSKAKLEYPSPPQTENAAP